MEKVIARSPEIAMSFVFWDIVICAFLYTVATYDLEMLVPCIFVLIIFFGLGSLMSFYHKPESVSIFKTNLKF